MSKTKQSYGMDFDDEASKLLEKALSSFDGIILGETPNSEKILGRRSMLLKIESMIVHLAWRESISHEYRLKLIVNKWSLFLVGDKGAHQQPSSNVSSAAQTLALALQQCKSSTPSPPDKETAETINAWLESYMPVSIRCCCCMWS